jgi:hypothetical protein
MEYYGYGYYDSLGYDMELIDMIYEKILSTPQRNTYVESLLGIPTDRKSNQIWRELMIGGSYCQLPAAKANTDYLGTDYRLLITTTT